MARVPAGHMNFVQCRPFVLGIVVGILIGMSVYHSAFNLGSSTANLEAIVKLENVSTSARAPDQAYQNSTNVHSSESATTTSVRAAPTSYFGGRPLCRTEFVERSFEHLEILQNEARLGKWLLHWEETIEEFLNVHPYSLRAGEHPAPMTPLVGSMHRKVRGWSKLVYSIALPPTGPKCRTSIAKFGPVNNPDGQKAVCWSDKSVFDSQDCYIISIGSRNLWDAEVDIFQRTKCRIHTFDCTSEDSMPKRIRERTQFHKQCIGASSFNRSVGSSDKPQEFISWPSMLKIIGKTTPPTYLKMDIEGWEYSVLRGMLRSGSELLPEMIAMEIHARLHAKSEGLPWKIRSKEIPELTGLALMMYHKGYRLIYIDWTTKCGHCLEVLWARVFC